MPTVQRISPCLWFDSEAEEAATFYTGIFKNSKIKTILDVALKKALPLSLLASVIALPLATIAALRSGGVVDQMIRATFTVTMAMPSFWIGIMMVLVTLTLWGWAPPVVFTPLVQ